MINHLNIQVTGKVQGVFYRASAVEEAKRLNIKGFARNEVDGSVYIEAEGSDEDLSSFLQWCAKGPGHAVVAEVTTTNGEVTGFKEFGIKR